MSSRLHAAHVGTASPCNSPTGYRRSRKLRPVSATAQKLEKSPAPPAEGAGLVGSGRKLLQPVLSNVQSFIMPRPGSAAAEQPAGPPLDKERLEALLVDVKQGSSRSAASALETKRCEEGVATAAAQMIEIQAALAAQAVAAQKAGVGQSLAVPLMVLPPFMQPPPPPPPKVVERQRERPVEVQRERVVEVAQEGEGAVRSEGPVQGGAYGTGREVLLQGFNWDSWKHNWYQKLSDEADWLASLGFSLIWMPPPTDSVSREGYMPRDLYNLDSAYGSKDALKRCVARLKEAGLRPLADAVLNHRCATHQNKDGTWNLFGGKLAWDERAICSDDPHFKGRGNRKSGDVYGAAPNVDHSQDFVRRDLAEWLQWLLEDIGYEGFRLDYVRGYSGTHIKEYMEVCKPHFCVGEYWDSLAYDGGSLEANQNAHRQRIINWINSAGGLATAFDMTTKGILHAVFERGDYWRLRDDKGKPPGVVGWWPSRAVTFLENHDTGSTQGHWRFPHHGLQQGYCYILTHPGTPTVFYDHLHDRHLQPVIRDLMALRKRLGLHVTSSVKILQADHSCYAAEIDSKLAMKIGGGEFHPSGSGWRTAHQGHDWHVWTRE